ncbi:preprotein translocase subunit SecE [Actinomyces sp. 432]|uniref:preprotein translocase subunit SecE n=1 Tax=Actinomyces sp. 432 TaxID=2057798 RepID=UPI00137450AB|nr:preprotein translocase subunit SecE [Actinomyces sp. 432]QHO91672.1 preprotein translocase subunit SecE [Actinomyces sp. 432]
MSDTTVAKGARKQRRGPFSRVSLYFRQVIDELRKVVWPTRSELWTYFAVVVVFILAIMLFTGALDAVFDRLVLWVFA